jgi:hypothetical protein
MMLPSWQSALLLAAAMLAAYTLGWRLGRRWPRLGAGPLSQLDRATLAILGLLLAFTFSLAMTEHSMRRQRAIEDASAIGNFYRCAGFLDEPVRGRLQNLVRRYLQRRLMLAYAPDKEAALARELPVISQMHLEMEGLVREAVAQKSPVTTPLANGLNQVANSTAARLAAVHHRLPGSVLLLLSVAAIASIFVIGAEQAAAGQRNLVQIVVFVVLVSLVVWATLDFNQPGPGAITANQEPLQRLLTTMAR